MNDEQLNNELKKRIKAVFNDYHDDTAEKGWQLLREKYPEDKEKRPVVWLWRLVGAAALLLMFLSIGLWLHFHEETKPALVVKSSKAKPAPAIIIGSQHASTNPDTKIAQQKTPKITRHLSKNNSKNSLVAANSNADIKPAITNNNNASKTADSSITNTAFINKPANSVQTTDAVQNTIATATSPVVKNQTVPQAQPGKSIQSLFDNDKSQSVQNTDEQKLKSKKVMFTIYAATYVNYAKGSTKQFNTGGGITTDIKLTENLSISTGVALAQNSLAYTGATSPQISANAAFLAHNLQNTVKPFSFSNPTSRDLNASLLNLDVPVNFKYVFNPQKRNVYLAAGLSSGAFINETYNYTYNYSGANNTAPAQLQESNHNNFDNFYFASLLNLSFGVGYPLGKDQLVLEPFLKYPINGLGDQHILFGSGGINLKINFGSSKK